MILLQIARVNQKGAFHAMAFSNYSDDLLYSVLTHLVSTYTTRLSHLHKTPFSSFYCRNFFIKRNVIQYFVDLAISCNYSLSNLAFLADCGTKVIFTNFSLKNDLSPEATVIGTARKSLYN